MLVVMARAAFFPQMFYASHVAQRLNLTGPGEALTASDARAVAQVLRADGHAPPFPGPLLAGFGTLAVTMWFVALFGDLALALAGADLDKFRVTEGACGGRRSLRAWP